MGQGVWLGDDDDGPSGLWLDNESPNCRKKHHLTLALSSRCGRAAPYPE